MMGSWQIFAATMVMAGTMAGVLLSLRPQRVSNGRSVAEIRARIGAETSDPLVLLSGHGEPDHALDVAEAHRIMREHLDCTAAACPCKAAALRALVDAGRVTRHVPGR
jgi:hypothetical protein